jgi:TolB-like protein
LAVRGSSGIAGCRRPVSVPAGKAVDRSAAFNNMSGDPDQEYFSDGITEDIITGLSQNHGIFFIAHNSSYTYKGRPVDVSRVGRELGVRYVLEGSVRRAGEHVRITAQLTEAERRAHIWASRYDRELTDIFAVQDEITRSIVATVAPEMLDAEMRRVRRKQPQMLGAWRAVASGAPHPRRPCRGPSPRGASDGPRSWSVAGIQHRRLHPHPRGCPRLEHLGDASVLAAYQAAMKAVALDSRDAASQTALGACEVLDTYRVPALAAAT